jgi:hypothetical protein
LTSVLRVAVRPQRRLVIVAAFVMASCLLPHAPGAQAAVQAASAGRYVPLGDGGPWLAGQSLLWTERTASMGYRLKVLRPGARSAAVLRSKGAHFRGHGYLQVGVWGSPSSVLVGETDVGGSTYPIFGPANMLAAPLGQSSFARVAASCLWEDYCGSPGLNADLDGSVAVLPTGVQSQAVVRDLAGSGQGVVLDNVATPKVAGRYVAWRLPFGLNIRQVVVYDWVARREAYRVTGPHAGNVDLVDLQSDGTVLFRNSPFGSPRGADPLYFWASPSEPSPHPQSLAPRTGDFNLTGGDFRALRNGTIIYPVVRRSRGQKVVELRRARLGGGDLGRLAAGANLVGLGDFDGERLSWRERGCNGVRVLAAPLAKLNARPRRVRDCRLRLSRNPAVVRPGVMRLRQSCVGFDRDCGADVLSMRATRTYRARGQGLRKGHSLLQRPVRDRLRDDRACRGCTELRLTQAAKAVIRRRPVRARLTMRYGEGPTRSAYVTVRTVRNR